MSEPAFQLESRERNLSRLAGERFDVLIVGGGINGAGIARDLALRARDAGAELRVALVEQGHFACGTSGRNSHLIHGGLRYLKQLQFRLVRESLHERAVLLEIAPHLVAPLPFLLPLYGWRTRLLYGTGLWLYDRLAGRRGVGRRRMLSRRETLALEPGLAVEGLDAGALFYDCQVNSGRFLLENIFDAARAGAVVLNYAAASEISASGALVEDALTGRRFAVRARKVVDARGPWAPGLRLVRGSHLVYPRIQAGQHAIAHFEEHGRIIFVIPWDGGRLSLVGTTDVDHTAGPDRVAVSAEEVRYLRRIVARLLPAAAAVEPLAAFSSLRPLLDAASGSPTRASREHRVWNDVGVLHVAGGKYTTYRAMSEEAVNLAAAEVAPTLRGRCRTGTMPLGGNTREGLDALLASVSDMARAAGLELSAVERLAGDYGLLAPAVLALLPERPAAGLDRLQAAQIAFAVRHEMARRLTDLLFISTHWGYGRRWTETDLRPFAEAMGSLLGWDESRAGDEVRRALQAAAVPPG